MIVSGGFLFYFWKNRKVLHLPWTAYRRCCLMTNEQKEIIMRMRAEGHGYTSVANTVGLPKDTVKSFCRRNGLAGQSAHYASQEKGKRCPQCGAQIERKAKVKPRRFCSSACRQAWWNAHLDHVEKKAVYTFVCAECGEPFTAYGNNSRKYCSHMCYVKARFKGGAARDERAV